MRIDWRAMGGKVPVYTQGGCGRVAVFKFWRGKRNYVCTSVMRQGSCYTNTGWLCIDWILETVAVCTDWMSQVG